MKALILAAGYGTRLYSLVKDTPKALLPVRDKPLVDYILEKISDIKGLEDVLLVTNNKFYDRMVGWAENHSNDYPHKISVVNDMTNSPEERLGSIGDIQFVLKEKNITDDVLVIGGDNLFNYNVDEYVEFARGKGDGVSIGLYDINSLEEARKFGVVSIDSSNRIVLFQEKPEKPESSLIAMCFYYLPSSTLGLIQEYLSKTEKSDRAGDYIKWLLEKINVYGFKFSGKWFDIGSVESYKDAQENFR